MELSKDGKDIYLRFGGAALAMMLHLRYDKMRAGHLDDKDNGHMYYPCREMLQFLTAVDSNTKENVYKASFKEHGAELLHIVSSTLQQANHLKALFVDLLVIKIPEFDESQSILFTLSYYAS